MDRHEQQRLNRVGQTLLLVVWVVGGVLGSWAIDFSPPLAVAGIWFLALFLGGAVHRYITGSW